MDGQENKSPQIHQSTAKNIPGAKKHEKNTKNTNSLNMNEDLENYDDGEMKGIENPHFKDERSVAQMYQKMSQVNL